MCTASEQGKFRRENMGLRNRIEELQEVSEFWMERAEMQRIVIELQNTELHTLRDTLEKMKPATPISVLRWRSTLKGNDDAR